MSYFVDVTIECPDREDLRVTALARVRRQRMLALGIVVMIALGLPTAAVTTGHDGPWSAGRVAALLVPSVVTIALMAALYPLIRRRDRQPTLAYGADRQTQRAVRRALRTGEPGDARIDALTRDAATKALRSTWGVRLLVGSVVLQLIGTALSLVGGTSPARLGLSVLSMLIFGTFAATVVVNRRRSRAYLNRPTD